MRICMIYPNNPPFYADTHETSGLGGSESGFVNTFRELVKLGHRVEVFNQWTLPIDTGAYSWDHLSRFDRNRAYDVVYSLRHANVFDTIMPNVGLRVLFLADTESYGLGQRFLDGKIDLVMSVSNWQKEKIAKEETLHDDNWMVTSNGIMPDDGKPISKIRGRCLFMATPERGLPTLLDVWERIVAKVPWATLETFSSFIGWGTPPDQNDEMCRDWYPRMQQMPSIQNPKHAPAAQVRLGESLAEFYLYPTDFYETRCMSVLESMYQQAIPIVTARAALMEEVCHGVTGFLIPTYGAGRRRYQDLFVETVVQQLLRDPNELQFMRANCRRYAEQFTYPKLVADWVAEWEWRLADKSWHNVG